MGFELRAYRASNIKEEKTCLPTVLPVAWLAKRISKMKNFEKKKIQKISRNFREVNFFSKFEKTV